MDKHNLIELFNLKYDNKYDYSLNDNFGLYDKISIICPEHGIFKEIANGHLLGLTCKKCLLNEKVFKLSKLDIFIKKANEKYDNKYDYSLVNYLNAKTNVKIICPIHGEFEQTPDTHLNRNGCKKCKLDNKNNNKVIETFINNSNIIHNQKYKYDKSTYTNAKSKMKIICSIHGEFEQIPDNHLNKKYGCPKCGLSYNKSEEELKDFIKSLNIDIVENNKQIIPPLELDIYIPLYELAIEYDGLYWHSELYKDKNYHLNKTIECEKLGIQLIHVFEDEWLHKKDIVKSRVKNILGLTSNKIFARKCIIKEISSINSKEFLNNNHIQGNVNSSIKLGLYYNDELVSIMTFGSLRKNLGQKQEDGKYELLRFCNKLDTTVIGGASKLLKHFIKTYQPKQIISYADRRWSIGNLYEKLGFDLTHNSQPNYFYINGLVRENRFSYRKDILIKEGYDVNKSEHCIMLERKIYRIYDCGCKKYELNIN